MVETLIKLLMNDNIQKAVNNVEAVAVLSDKAEDLEAQSSLFRTEAVAARRQECFKKWKLNLCLAAVVVAAVLGGAPRASPGYIGIYNDI